MKKTFLCLLQLPFMVTTMAALTSCITIGNANKPITAVLAPAHEAQPQSDTLIVVLPGFGVDADDMQKNDIDKAIHASWPEADVLMTNATFAYYKERNIVDRLQQDVIEPARRRGYQHIWLAGASVGGMGALFYEYAYPGVMDGIVLLAPWLGGKGILEEIQQSGGIQQWQPGPIPATVDDDNYQRELWRVVKSWATNPAMAQRVWLVCGDEDKLLNTSRTLAPALQASHYLEIPGSHDWKTFASAATRIIQEIRENSLAPLQASNN